jgi:hypothetical protein
MHTAGSWKKETRVRRIISEGVPIIAPDGSGIAWVLGGNSDECKANASLIVKAPDMLTALKDIKTFLGSAVKIYRDGELATEQAEISEKYSMLCRLIDKAELI